MRKTEILMDGLTFGEGPRWHDGKFYFSDFYSHKVFSLDMKGNSKLIVEIPNQPSGLGWLSDGTMLIVSMKDRKLMSYKNNVLKEVADLSSLAGFHCNDMVVDSQGNAYIGNFGFNTYSREEIRPANLILVRPGEDPCLAADDLLFPNGTVITPDGKTLIVGETCAARLTAFDINQEWLDGGSKADLRSNKGKSVLHPKSNTWSQSLDAEPMGLSEINNTLCFSSRNRGIYRINSDSEVIWKTDFPKWEGIEEAQDKIVGFTETTEGLVLVSHAGGIAIYDENGILIEKKILKLLNNSAYYFRLILKPIFTCLGLE